jgi:hypothetical protein
MGNDIFGVQGEVRHFQHIPYYARYEKSTSTWLENESKIITKILIQECGIYFSWVVLLIALYLQRYCGFQDVNFISLHMI